MFTKEKNTHKTNKLLLAQFELTVLDSPPWGTIFPCLIEGFSVPVKEFLWNIHSYITKV